MDFFYDEQIKRYLLQFMRIFSTMSYQTDPDENGIRIQKRIPIKYGDMSRLVGSIINNNNQNTTISIPAMAATITGIKQASDRRCDTFNVSPMQLSERSFDDNTQQYTDKVENKYTIERYMPVPYDINMQLDICTSNTNTKFQIMEQILCIFNPSIQLQQNDNPADWSSIFEVWLTDIKFSNRSLPVGTSIEYDIASLSFKISGWLNPPAKVKRQRIIEQLSTNVYCSNLELQSIDDLKTQQIVITDVLSFADNMISLDIDENNNVVVDLLSKFGGPTTDTWKTLFNKYGSVINGQTRLQLKTNDDIHSTDGIIYGSITYDNDTMVFNVDPDSLPPNISSGPINQIIDVTSDFDTTILSSPSIGDRYLILSSYSNKEEPALSNNPLFGLITCYENDIIEFDGNQWIVSFNSRAEQSNQYVYNRGDGHQYKFTGNEWIYSFLGHFNVGYWRLENLQGIQ